MDTRTPIRVLVVDDHRHIHEVISRVLVGIPDIGLVGQAANGAEALRLCEDVRPDLVLMDVVMPIMDGMQATQRIHQKFPHLKILVLPSWESPVPFLDFLRTMTVLSLASLLPSCQR